MEYIILSDISFFEVTGEWLTIIVNEYIRKGWIPLGGVSADGTSFYQAMTREIKEENNPL